MFEWSQWGHGPGREAHRIVLPCHKTFITRGRVKVFILTHVLKNRERHTKGCKHNSYCSSVCVHVCMRVCVRYITSFHQKLSRANFLKELIVLHIYKKHRLGTGSAQFVTLMYINILTKRWTCTYNSKRDAPVCILLSTSPDNWWVLYHLSRKSSPYGNVTPDSMTKKVTLTCPTSKKACCYIPTGL